MNDSTTTVPRLDSSRAISNEARTSSSSLRSRQTPRPWLPSNGFTTTGYPIRRATDTAWSAVRTASALGTGRPADPRSLVVSSLSPAMSTASAEVFDVIVARMRWAWTPCPSCTREYWFSRCQGMSRDTASSRIAWVLGPNPIRCAFRRKASTDSRGSNPSSAPIRWLTSRTASCPAARAIRSSVNAYTTL